VGTSSRWEKVFFKLSSNGSNKIGCQLGDATPSLFDFELSDSSVRKKKTKKIKF
jgi:hypothetical protein